MNLGCETPRGVLRFGPWGQGYVRGCGFHGQVCWRGDGGEMDGRWGAHSFHKQAFDFIKDAGHLPCEFDGKGFPLFHKASCILIMNCFKHMKNYRD